MTHFNISVTVELCSDNKMKMKYFIIRPFRNNLSSRPTVICHYCYALKERVFCYTFGLKRASGYSLKGYSLVDTFMILFPPKIFVKEKIDRDRLPQGCRAATRSQVTFNNLAIKSACGYAKYLFSL